MKKTLVALAALAAAGASFAQTTNGQPGFQVTGNWNAGYSANDYKGNTAAGFEQNGFGTSQLNFRGLEDLGGGMSAYFFHETDWQFMTNRGDQGVAPGAFTGTATTFGNGSKVVGLRGSFGDVGFGTINDAALMNYVLLVAPVAGTSYAGGYGIITYANPVGGIVRYDNTVQYKSPKLADALNLWLTYAPKQTAVFPAKANYSPTLGANDIANDASNGGVVELSAIYASGPLKASYTYAKTDNIDNLNVGYVGTLSALGLAYDITPSFKLTAGYETLVKSGNNNVGNNVAERAAYILGGYYSFGANTVFAQYGSLKENAAGAPVALQGQSTTMVGLGYKYELSKMTSLQARYERTDDQAGVVGIGNFTAAAGNTVRVRSMFGVAMNF